MPWLRLQRPVSVIMMGLMSAGKWNLMHHIALGDPSKPELETKDVMRDEWQNKVQLQQMAMTSMNIGDIMSVKYNRRLKALVKEHSDGIILVIDATRTDSQDMEEILSELKQYVLDANETKDSVLLVLVNRSDKEVRDFSLLDLGDELSIGQGAISIHQIEQNVTETLVRHNRGSQCFVS